MFVFAYATLALATVGSVSGLVVPRKEPPKGWLPSILEDYNVYHTRYLALGCENKHNTAFFNQCCHPLLKSQKLSDRPAQCTPSKTTTSVAAPPTATDDGDGDDDECDDSDDDATSQVPTSTVHSASTSHTASASHAVKTTSEPASTHKPSSTQAAATPSKSAAPNSGSSQVFTDGFATFFFQNGVAGACGVIHSDSDLIAAIDERRYGNSGLKSALCGKQVEITNPKNGKSVVVTIVDDCPTCNNADSIDLSVAAFNKIATEAEGMVNIHWKFI